MTRILLFSFLLVSVSALAYAQSIQVCNDFSFLPGKACTGAGDCPDADAADAGAGACITTTGVELDICNNFSLNAGVKCFNNDANCPDRSSGDAGQGGCGVLTFQDPASGKFYPYKFHPEFGSSGFAVLSRQAFAALALQIPIPSTDCPETVNTAILNQLCHDTQMWKCARPADGGASTTFCDDADEWDALSSASSGTLQELVDASVVGGKVTLTLPSGGLTFIIPTLAKALRICETTGETNCGRFYAPTGGRLTLDVIPAGDTVVDAAAASDIVFKLNTVEAMRIQDTGSIQYSGAWKPRVPMTWQAGSMSVDGTICTLSTSVYARGTAVVCSAANGSFVWWIKTRDNFDPSVSLTADFTIETETTASQVWSADLTCVCSRDNVARPTDTEFDADGTTESNQITISTGTIDGVLQDALIPSIECGGSCASGDYIFFRAKTDAALTATNDFFLSGAINFSQDQIGED